MQGQHVCWHSSNWKLTQPFYWSHRERGFKSSTRRLTCKQTCSVLYVPGGFSLLCFLLSHFYWKRPVWCGLCPPALFKSTVSSAETCFPISQNAPTSGKKSNNPQAAVRRPLGFTLTLSLNDTWIFSETTGSADGVCWRRADRLGMTRFFIHNRYFLDVTCNYGQLQSAIVLKINESTLSWVVSTLVCSAFCIVTAEWTVLTGRLKAAT